MNTTHYQIRVKSHLGPNSAAAFDGFTVQHTADGDTILTGPVTDQAALHGILMKIRDLGLALVEVKTINSQSHSR